MWHTRWKTATRFAQVMGCWGTLICERHGSIPMFFIGGQHVSAVHCQDGCHADPHKNPCELVTQAETIETATFLAHSSPTVVACYTDRNR